MNIEDSRYLPFCIRRYGHGHFETFVAGCNCKPCAGAFKFHVAVRRSLTINKGRPGKGQRERLPKSKHGTRSRYVWGCRCSKCAKAESAYQRERRAKKRAA